MWTSHIGFFCSLTLELNYFILKEIPTNSYKLEQRNIFVSKKYTSQGMKNCKYTSKLRLWVEFCNELFGGEQY
jgi:hypothetical protein